MKKKIYIAMLAMCLTLAAGCGEKEEKENSAEVQTEIKTETETEAKAEKADGTNTRLVSVDNVEKYITLGEYKGIVLDSSVIEVTEEDIENQIRQSLQAAAEEVTDKNEMVQNGDTAVINFVGTKDGVEFEGGSGENYDLVIGSGTMIPGFEEGIVGMKKGESKDVPVTFPEEYSSTELAGADAVFKITVQSFSRPPELTNEWIAANTEYKTAEEYRASVKTSLEESAQQQAESSLQDTAWTTVSANSEVKEYPQEDIDDAAAEYTRMIQRYADQSGMELEAFIESQGVSSEDFEEQKQQYAEAKVKQNLILQGIMDAEGMTLEDEESLAIQEQLVQQYGAGNLATLVDTYGQEEVDSAIGLIRVRDFIVSNANVEQAADTSEAADASADQTEENAGE